MALVLQSFNQDWKYQDNFQTSYLNKDFNDDSFESICLPHTNKETPYNYFDEKINQFVSCYRKEFTISKDYKNKRVFIDFDGVMTHAKIFINGNAVQEHKGGYTAFSVEITNYIEYQAPNIIVVQVDSNERADIPPFGFVIDYLTFGGIYRDVSLRIEEAIYISNVFAMPKNILDIEKSLQVQVFINNPLARSSEMVLNIELWDMEGNLVRRLQETIHITPGDNTKHLILDSLKNIELWDVDFPYLYTIDISLTMPAEKDSNTTSYQVRTGFRQASFTTSGFYLNGKPLKIIGLNRHQSYPYVGYAMPKRVQAKDADILKYQLALNTVRTSHYPQSVHFLNRCDEIGLLVFEEMPGWQHIGDDAWKDVACENLSDMIQKDWNHPSIILWGARINESKDDHDFYTKTNAIAKTLDPSRPTGGVRAHEKSEFLEDVFTMNDFIFNRNGSTRISRPQQETTGLNYNVPYLITEYGGHMYPTKRFDQEVRVDKHAFIHARMVNSVKLDPTMSGCIGWCAFDYNTHHQFGAGDHICYHGVMDMFRQAKYAAYAYSSQKDPKQGVVLEPVTHFARGERDQAALTPLTIYTNCDRIDFYSGGILKGQYYPDYNNFAGLAHPPIVIHTMEGTWGSGWQDGEFVGIIKDKIVTRRVFSANPVLSDLHVTCDDASLLHGDWDSTKINLEAIDQCGNIVQHTENIINVSIQGPATIIGPSTFALIGGAKAFWIRTKGDIGQVTINITLSNITTKEITLQVI